MGGPEQNGLQSEGGGDHVDGLNTSDVIVDWEPNISATQTVHSKSDFLVAYSTPEGRQCVTTLLLLQCVFDCIKSSDDLP